MRAAAQPPLCPSQQTALSHIDQRVDLLKRVNRQIWEFAEVGYQEVKSSALLRDELRSHGFKIEENIAGITLPSSRPGAADRR